MSFFVASDPSSTLRAATVGICLAGYRSCALLYPKHASVRRASPGYLVAICHTSHLSITPTCHFFVRRKRQLRTNTHPSPCSLFNMSFDSSPCPRRGEGRPFQLSPSPKPKIEPSSVTSQVKPRIKFPSAALVEPDPFVFQPKQLFPSPVRGLQSEQAGLSKGHQAVKKGGRRIPGVKMSRQQRLVSDRSAAREIKAKDL